MKLTSVADAFHVRTLLCAVLVLAFSGGARAEHGGTDGGHGLGPQSLWEWQFAGDPRISPDGKRIVWVQARIDRERDAYDYDLWLREADGEVRALTRGVHDDRAPRWSPQGDRIAFASNRAGKRQIFILELRGGEPWQLTDDAEGVGAFAWSPDGRRIAFTSSAALEGEPGYEPPGKEEKKGDKEDKPSREAMVTESLRVRFDGAPGWRDEKVTHIWTVATDRGAKQPAVRVTRGKFDDGAPVWSADGRTLFFSADRREDSDYSNNSEIYAVPADGSAEPRALTTRNGPDENPLPSPDGRWIAFTGYDETTPPRSAYVDRLYVMRPDGSEVRELSAQFDRSVPDAMTIDSMAPRVNGTRIAWTPDSRQLLFVSTDRGQTHLYAVNVARGGVEPLTRFAQGELREFTIGGKNQVAALFATPTQPAEVFAFPLKAAGKTDDWERLSNHSLGLAGDGEFVPYEEIWYDSFDGKRIQGWILKPPGFDASKKYPLMLYIHGGPHAMYGTGFFHEFQVLANTGYVVLITNPRGSTGYGGEFANIIQYRYPGDDYKDLMAGVDEVLERGYVDAGRMGVAGGSGGGVLTSWTVGHTTRFRAALVERPVINWYNFVNSADLNYFFVTRWFRDFPWRDPEDYLARSTLSYVDKVETPVLVIQSEEDYRTPLDQGLQYYTALKMLKKPARLIVFPESSHGLSREGPPSQRVQRLELILEWFNEKLKP